MELRTEIHLITRVEELPNKVTKRQRADLACEFLRSLCNTPQKSISDSGIAGLTGLTE